MKAIAQRYASALAQAALEDKTLEKTRTELAGFLDLFNESSDLRNFVNNPSIPRTEKHGLIEKIVKRLGAGKILRNFLFVLADNRRMPLLPEIHQEFVSQLHDRLGVAEALVQTAQEINEQEKAELCETLERLTGKKVEARFQLDPRLIGGVVVRIGSTVYDGSVRQQLDRMRQTLGGE